MKCFLFLTTLSLSLLALPGCENSSENTVMPAPQMTAEDYEKQAAEEEAEQKRISGRPGNKD